jgi:hypothetical protein
MYGHDAEEEEDDVVVGNVRKGFLDDGLTINLRRQAAADTTTATTAIPVSVGSKE